MLFVHHSVGRYMIQHGDMRGTLRSHGIGLWDCDYNKVGARDATGTPITTPEVPDDNTDPDGLLRIFTRGSPDDRRFVAWLETFDLVALKSCYPTSNITTDEQLRARKDLYAQLADAASRLLPRTVLVTPPPLAPLRTTAANAARACDLARWLAEDLQCPDNVSTFDLHQLLAHPDGQGDGTLASRYRRLLPVDSHPNTAGARAAGRGLADYLVHAIDAHISEES